MALTIEETINLILDEIDQDEKSWLETVKAGDLIDSDEDGFFLSGPKYKTKGKLYEVQEVYCLTNQNGDTRYCYAIVYGDYVDPTTSNIETIRLSPSKFIIRNGKIIWESSIVKATRVLLNSNEPLDAEQRKTMEDYLSYSS